MLLCSYTRDFKCLIYVVCLFLKEKVILKITLSFNIWSIFLTVNHEQLRQFLSIDWPCASEKKNHVYLSINTIVSY